MDSSQFSDARQYAPFVLRLGLSFVLVWFGLTQILHPAAWTSFIPEWIVSMSGMNAMQFVVVNGSIELILAALLAFGIWVRVAASLVFLHLAAIVIEVGLTGVGVRDIGLAVAALSVALHGKDEFCL